MRLETLRCYIVSQFKLRGADPELVLWTMYLGLYSSKFIYLPFYLQFYHSFFTLRLSEPLWVIFDVMAAIMVM